MHSFPPQWGLCIGGSLLILPWKVLTLRSRTGQEAPPREPSPRLWDRTATLPPLGPGSTSLVLYGSPSSGQSPAACNGPGPSRPDAASCRHPGLLWFCGEKQFSTDWSCPAAGSWGTPAQARALIPLAACLLSTRVKNTGSRAGDPPFLRDCSLSSVRWRFFAHLLLPCLCLGGSSAGAGVTGGVPAPVDAPGHFLHTQPGAHLCATDQALGGAGEPWGAECSVSCGQDSPGADEPPMQEPGSRSPGPPG